jgi:PAS domain S-box-containing protein
MDNLEERRLKSLQQYQILDTLPEKAFDEIAYLAATICEAPIALVSFVDADRQWFKACVGVNMRESRRQQSFCAQAILQPDEITIIPNALEDERFRENALVTGEMGIRFYAGVPLVAADGMAVGVLCVMDKVPRQLTERQLTALKMLSRSVLSELELRRLSQVRVYAEELSQANAQLQTALDNSSALYQISQSLMKIEKLDDAIQQAANLMANALAFERIAIITVDIEKQQVLNYYRGGPGKKELLDITFPHLWDGLSGWVLRELKPALSPKDLPDPRESEAVQQRRLETNCGAIIVIPIVYENKILGTITAINRSDQRDFTQTDVDLLGPLANQIAIVIINNRLYRDLVAEVNTRQQAEADLLQSQHELERRVEERTAALSATNTLLSQEISERQRAEKTQRATLDALSAHICVLDENGTIIFVNRAWCEFAAANPPTPKNYYLGENYLTICYQAQGENSAGAAELADGIRAIMAGHLHYYQAEYPCHSPNEKRWFVVKATPFYGEGPVRVAITHENITERKKAEESIRWHLTELEAIYENGLAINRLMDPQLIGQKVVDVLSEKLFWHHAVVRLYEPQTAQFKVLALNLPDASKAELEEQINYLNSIVPDTSKGFTGWVVRQGKPIRVGNLAIEPLYMETYSGMRSGLYVPLMAGQRILGVISVESEAENGFSEQDENLLTTLANQAAIAIENAQLYLMVQKELEERRRAEQALAEREALYRQAIVAANAIPYVLDYGKRQYTFIGEAIEELTGYPREGLSPENLDSLIIDSVMQGNFKGVPMAEAVQRVRSGEYGLFWVCDHHILTRTGEERWFTDASIQVLGEDGIPKGSIGSFQDITERKKNELALRQSEENYRQLAQELEQRVRERTAEVQDLYDYAPTGYHSLDADGKYIMINQTELSWLGYTRDEMLGHAFSEFLSPASLDTFYAVYPVFKQQGVVHDIEFDMQRKDGSFLPILLNAIAVYDASGVYLNSRSTIFDLTERRKAENALRESEEIYRALFETANDAIFLLDVKDSRYTRVNPRCPELLGFNSTDEMIGRYANEFIVPSQTDDARQRHDQLMRGERISPYERTFIRQNGEKIQAEITLSMIRDNAGKPKLIQSVVRDITKRKRAENALRESEEQNRLLFEESPDAITLLDNLGKIVRVNRAYEQMTRFSRAEMLGKTAEELGLVTSGVRDGLREALIQATTRHETFATSEYPMTCGDGSTLDVESRIFLLNLGGTEHILVTTRDISARKQAEDALRRANIGMEQAIRMKDEFLASMSHELRTPLTGILGLSEALQIQAYGNLNEKQLRAVQNIETSGRHLLELINDILDLSKIEAGKLEMQFEPCLLGDICQASLQLTRAMAQKKHHQVSFAMKPATIRARADARRLKQMLVNLLSNAIKFTAEGGSLGLEVDATQDDSLVRISVWDTGIGIKPEDLKRLFQPFVQLDSSLSRQYSGTGLGLSLVKRMAELHNGELEVQSTPGQGSRFTLILPRLPDDATRPYSNAESLPDAKTKSRLAGFTPPPLVMVVDDNEVNVDTITGYLEAQQFHLAVARNGQEFLKQVETVRPSIVLMDIQMPGMDGLEVIRRLRAHPDAAIAGLPVIAITALAMPGDQERCLAAGANAYMSKPIVLRELAQKIIDLLCLNRC